jgi:hypothetical protein
VTLAVLGIALPYADEGEKPRAPQVSRADGEEEPTRKHDGKQPATPGPAARPESGPLWIPGAGKPLAVTASLVPTLPEPSAPKVPEVPAAPAVPTVPSAPAVPSPPADVRLPSPEPAPSRPAAPTDAGEPSVDLPAGSVPPTDVPKPLG